MKKILVYLLALTLCVGLFCAIPVSAEETEPEETHTIVLSNAETIDGWNAYKFYNVALNHKYVKEGNASVRVDTQHTQVVFLLEFDEPKDISVLKGEDIYLEMWIYAVNAVQLSKSTTAQIELSSVKENGTDSYFWNMAGHQYTDGWNYLSIKLDDDLMYGNPDITSLKSLRYTVFVPVQTAIYVDGVTITDTPRQVSQSELGVIEPDSPYVNVDVDLPSSSPLSVVSTVFMVIAIVAVAAFAVILTVTLKSKKGGRKDENE